MADITETEPGAVRVAVVGLGQQGAGVANLLARQGHTVAGGVDIGDKVGARVAGIAAEVTGDALVYGSVEDLVASVPDLDVVILAAAIDLDTTVAQARTLLAAGVNVLTLHQDVFEPAGDWADELHAIGQSSGASLLASGVQDTWWVQIPAVAAASTRDIRTVRIEHLIDLESIAPGIMEAWGIGVAEGDFAPYRAENEKLPPILGVPLRLAARAMGLTPGEVAYRLEPIVATEEVSWRAGRRTLPVGAVIGTDEITSFETAEGVRFEGSLRMRPLGADEHPSDIVDIDAEPPLHLEHKPFPGQQVTNIAIVARVPDIVAAPGGVYTVADLGPASYRHASRQEK